MKTKFLLLLALISNTIFAQSINDFAAVIVPVKYSFQSEENQFRLSTLTKYNLEKAGITGVYSNSDYTIEFPDRCSLLTVDLVKQSGFLVTKLVVEFRDCYGKVIYTSEVGRSKEKDYGDAYRDALSDAFKSIISLGYKYNGKKGASRDQQIVKAVPATNPVATVVTSTTATNTTEMLFAQPTETGYQLIDKTPKVVMKLMKTGNPNSFIAIRGEVQGILNLKDNQWVFESYQNGVLVSEVIAVKF